ncbi:MAG: ParB/RepB/Spo0J family partition protein [Betaproteobacteria bacterium]
MAGFKRRTTSEDATAMRALVTEITRSPEVSPEKDSEVPTHLSPQHNSHPTEQRVIEVDLADVRENPWNARRAVSTAKLEKFTESMTKVGQLTPAAGFIDPNGRVTLIDGHCRLRAALAAGLPSLRIELHPQPTSPLQMYLLSRQINVERAEQTCLDDALAWRLLLDRKIFRTQLSLSETVGVSEAVVSKTLALAELPPAIIAGVVDLSELVALRPLYELYQFWKARGDEETLELVADARKRGLSARDIEARRKAAERGRGAKPRSVRRAFSYSGARGELRRFEGEGRLELSVRGLSAAALADLEGKIAQLVSAAPELALI